MNVRSGQVRRVADGFAWVDVERQSGCGRCAESGGCGRACESAAATYVIPVDVAVLPGERVDVVVSQRAPLIAALLTYGATQLDVKDYQGKTPLQNATDRNLPDLVTLLRKHGAKE